MCRGERRGEKKRLVQKMCRCNESLKCRFCSLGWDSLTEHEISRINEKESWERSSPGSEHLFFVQEERDARARTAHKWEKEVGVLIVLKKKKGLMWTGRECTAPPFVKRNGEKEPLSFSHPRPTHTDSATFFSFFLACLSALLTVREFCAAVHQRSGAAAACPPAAHLHSSRSTHISVAGRRPGSGAGTLVHPPSRQQPRKAPRRAWAQKKGTRRAPSATPRTRQKRRTCCPTAVHDKSVLPGSAAANLSGHCSTTSLRSGRRPAARRSACGPSAPRRCRVTTAATATAAYPVASAPRCWCGPSRFGGPCQRWSCRGGRGGGVRRRRR